MQKITYLRTSGSFTMPILDSTHPKTIEVTWLFWISISMQKLSLLDPFIPEIQPILESQDQSGHTHF